MRKLLILCLSGIALASCKKDEPVEVVQETSALLQYSADYQIIPAYEVYRNELEELSLALTAFAAAPNVSGLEDVQVKLKDARIAWQYCAPYGFGPAESLELELRSNTFPVDTLAIEDQILAEVFTFQQADQWGLACLGYLFHHKQASDIVDEFSTDGRSNLALAIVADLLSRTTSVRDSWTGNYRASFVSSTGTQAGSGLSRIVNYGVRDYENFRRLSIALPLGLLTLGVPLEDRVEALHGNYSVELAQHRLEAHRRWFKGISRDEQVDGNGLEELLDESNAQFGGGLLSTAILADHADAATALSVIPEPLNQTILDQPEVVQEAYDQLQELLVHLKTDMSSALGVSITYSDNDGD